MAKYVILIALLLVSINNTIDINGMELNCFNMTTIETYTEYASRCPYVWPYNSIYTVIV